jgi:integrase
VLRTRLSVADASLLTPVGITPVGSKRSPQVLYAEFEDYLHRVGLDIERAKQPHALQYYRQCFARPRTWDERGAQIDGPIGDEIVEAAKTLQAFLQLTSSPFQITWDTIHLLTEIASQQPLKRRGAPAATIHEIKALARILATLSPYDLRLRAMILVFWSTWARTAELCHRIYPDDLRIADTDGILILVPRSKTNYGTKIETFRIRHNDDPLLCAVCGLRAWLDWLGPNYRGPLFPSFTRETRRPSGVPLNVLGLNRQLVTALRRANITTKLTSYSFRKGGATNAVLNGWQFNQVAAKLRHSTLSCTPDYIDTGALFTLMENVIE